MEEEEEKEEDAEEDYRQRFYSFSLSLEFAPWPDWKQPLTEARI